MQDFVFQNRTKIIFGKNKEQHVGEECAAYGKKLLLNYGGGSEWLVPKDHSFSA